MGDLQDAWAKELQVTQRELQDQLSTAHQKLQSQVEENSELHSELAALRKESAKLRMALDGQVFTDNTNGMLVHEQEEDDDGVLLSMTPVNGAGSSTRCSLTDDGQSGTSCISAKITSKFEILQSYFDPIVTKPSAASNAISHPLGKLTDSLSSHSSRVSSASSSSVSTSSVSSSTSGSSGSCNAPPSMFSASRSQQPVVTVDEMVQ